MWRYNKLLLQVGKDAAATRFLSALDTDPVIGSMIDCTSYYEQEQEEYARKVSLATQRDSNNNALLVEFLTKDCWKDNAIPFEYP